MTWDRPQRGARPRRGGRPQLKLRPNAFARIARFSAANAALMLILFVALAVACGGFAAATLRIEPEQRPRVALDPATAALQAELDRQFPGIEQTFLAIVEEPDPDAAREGAMALAAALASRQDLFQSAFVPGTGPYYDSQGILYGGLDQLRARVDALLQMEPLYLAMASAPDMAGFSQFVAEIGKAVEQGRSPAGLDAMLLKAAAAIEGQVAGRPDPVDWAALAGLEGAPSPTRWYVLASPHAGAEQAAAAFARAASSKLKGTSWLWPKRALTEAPSQLRDLAIPAILAVVLSAIVLWTMLGGVAEAGAVLLAAGVTLAAAAALAAALGRPLDGASWSFALAVVAPVTVSGGVMTLAYGKALQSRNSPLQAVMLAAHRQGGAVTAVTVLFAGFWAAWLFRQIPSLSLFAAIALASCVMAWIATLSLLPAALALFASRPRPEGVHWLDESLGEHVGHNGRGALDIVAMAVLALGVFSVVFLPSVRFGERQLPAAPALLETPDARGAVSILAPADQVNELVAQLSALPEVGAIRTAAQFLPPDAAAKIAELRRLKDVTPFDPAFRDGLGQAALQDSFDALQSRLSEIGDAAAASRALRESAQRLSRAVALFVGSQAPTAERAAALDRDLFSGLSGLTNAVQRLATLQAPAVADLDPRLLRRFVSADGMWRIEVMPRRNTGELTFAAAMRRAVPTAAGEPVVALVRNEMIHHETVLALASALAVAAGVVLAALQGGRGFVLALAPAAVFLTLIAAVSVLLGISLNAAMLAGASATMAVLVACAMQVARRLEAPPDAVREEVLPLRAALLAPLVLAAAAAPLTISSRPVVAEVGAALSLLLLIAALLALLLVPVLARWLDALERPEFPFDEG